jgi:Tol biopolymer transport system component
LTATSSAIWRSTSSAERADGNATEGTTVIGRTRWSIFLSVAALPLGSCGSASTDAGPDPAAAGADVSDSDPTEADEHASDSDPVGEVESTDGLPELGDGWLLFQAVYDGDVVDLGLVRSDGTELQRLPGGPGNRWHPDWSPDGTLIAYDHELPDGRGEIRIVGADGSDDRLVVGCEDPCLGQAGPAWSPDGRSIGFDGYEGPTDELEHERCYLAIHDLDTDEVRRIFEWPGCDQDQGAEDRGLSEGIYLRFSPDGQRIVFQGEGPRGEWAVFTSTVAGDEVTQLTDWNEGSRPDWSPDGEWIVFQGRENEHPDPQPGVGIHRTRPDGSDREQLTTPQGTARDYYPRWLPDGSAVLYSRCTDLWICEARLVDPDGSNDRLVLDGVGRQTVHFRLQPTPGR